MDWWPPNTRIQKANRDMLVKKIIAGGSGVWGQVPMAAHPNLSKEDALAMVKYIMLIKRSIKNKMTNKLIFAGCFA